MPATSHGCATLLRPAALLIALLAAPAAATTSSVFSPSVDEGERELEYRLSYSPEEERFDHRLHYQQAFDDALRARLIIAQRRRGTGDLELAYTRLETQWQYLEDRGDGRKAAMRAELQIAEGDDGPHRLRLAWTGSAELGERWQQRANLLAGREVGGGRAPGVSLELRLQTSYALAPGRRLGLELFSDFNTTADFGDFDDQGHQLGGIFTQSLGDRWNVQLSALAGVSDAAPDLTWRMLLIRAL